MYKFTILSPWSLVILMALAAFLLMYGPAWQDSAIMDELAHIPAGYSYVKYLDYRLNPEHPPLVKMLAGLPLIFKDLNFPTDKPSWTTDINGQWLAGAQFLYESGNNADQIIFWARLGPMLLTLLLIILTYIFAKEIVGRWWAILPTFFIAFSPHILAHGHYVTTDIGAALGIMIAIYAYLRYLFSPSNKNLVLAGLAFGIAQLMKFSAVLLIPHFFFTALFFAWAENKGFWKTFFKQLGRLILIGLIATALIYVFYFVTTINYPIEKQAADTDSILTSFGFRPAANLDIWMAKNPVFRPLAQYLLGVLMVTQRSAGGNTGYFLGEVSAAGWWYYFPVVFLMKESLPVLILIFAAIFFGAVNIFRNFKKFREYLSTNFIDFTILLFIVIYWAYSIKSNLNIGFRHLIPTLPFIYILTASAIRKWFAAGPEQMVNTWFKKLLNLLRRTLNFTVKSAILLVLLFWFLTNTIFGYPYFLSSFNEIFGGVKGGYQYAVDSNYDWGQDLKRLQIWADANLVPEEKIAVDYFGGGSPKYYLGGKRVELWRSSLGNPKEEGISWLAVSVNTLQGAIGRTAPGFSRNPIDEYRWLENPQFPTDRAGTSIFIYKL